MKRKRRLLLLFNNKNTKGTCFLNFGAGGAIATMVGGRGPQGTVPLRMWSLREKSPRGSCLPWRRTNEGAYFRTIQMVLGVGISFYQLWARVNMPLLEAWNPVRSLHWTGVTLRTGAWTMLLDISPLAPSKCSSTLNESPVFSRADLPIWWTWWILLNGVEFDAKWGTYLLGTEATLIL